MFEIFQIMKFGSYASRQFFKWCQKNARKLCADLTDILAELWKNWGKFLNFFYSNYNNIKPRLTVLLLTLLLFFFTVVVKYLYLTLLFTCRFTLPEISSFSISSIGSCFHGRCYVRFCLLRWASQVVFMSFTISSM